MVARASDGPDTSMDSLTTLREIARLAGTVILEYYGAGAAGRAAVAKLDGSPVTIADLAAQRVINDRLEDWDPGVPVISEEAELPSYSARRNWRRFWLVDPLDGTKEFISRNGEFTINIALIEDGEPVLGVVYAPALDVMYAAAKGLGAWRTGSDGVEVRIFHDAPEHDRALTVVESRSHGSPELEAYLDTIAVRERVRVGSSLKFCWVAEGRADIYPRLGPTMEWDVAAGDCIYRNSAREGEHPSPLTYNKPELRNGAFVVGAAASRARTPALT
jgi:3'(2'), 5'-bisphosphate nucleotidase